MEIDDSKMKYIHLDEKTLKKTYISILDTEQSLYELKTIVLVCDNLLYSEYLKSFILSIQKNIIRYYISSLKMNI